MVAALNPVEGSSNIVEQGYDPDSKLLLIRFSSGKLYEYRDFPPEEHAALLDADSIGKHFAREVRPNYSGVFVPNEDEGNVVAPQDLGRGEET